MPPVVIAGAIAGAGAIGGAAIGSHAAGKAADEQAAAARYAADLQKQTADQQLALQREALGYQQQQFATQQANIAPWLKAGTAGLNALQYGLGIGGKSVAGLTSGELMQPFDPSTVTMDPGFAFRLKEGQKALESSASARGAVLSGGALRSLTRYAQDYSSNEYSRAYERAFNTFQTNQANRYNRLASISGVGQTAANQLNANSQAAIEAQQRYAAMSGNILGASAAAQGDYATQAANARASGYLGSANAWSAGIGGATNALMNAYIQNRAYNQPYQTSFNLRDMAYSIPEYTGTPMPGPTWPA